MAIRAKRLSAVQRKRPATAATGDVCVADDGAHRDPGLHPADKASAVLSSPLVMLAPVPAEDKQGVTVAPEQLALLEEPVILPDLVPDPGSDYGEVFTRRWVVEMILDLMGYTSDKDLGDRVLLEPSCGTGAFLVPIVERLVQSCQRYDRDLSNLDTAVRAFDLLEANAERAKKAVALTLREAGLPQGECERLAARWVVTGDFLLHDHGAKGVDFVAGNPPYIRLENVPRSVMAAYRRLCPAMRGRSDIYVGFIERGLRLLKPAGVLGYICADRWMRNQYGAHLRELISGSYSVDAVVTMHDVDAFEDKVSAYPAIIVLRNGPQANAAVVEAGENFGDADAAAVTAWVRQTHRPTTTTPRFEASRLDHWFEGRDLWPTGSPAQLAVLADLETRFPSLQDERTGTRVGIGVATGCDDVYITTDAEIVERERLMPLIRADDTTSGVTSWSGSYLVSPWDESGLVDLGDYPRLKEYFERHAHRLRARHVARRCPAQWYRTIDKVDPALLRHPKLVLPDIKAAAHPVLDEGSYYPHHNLYFVVSEAWDLAVLGGLLLSDVANLFVGAYCVKMRGGCYRFQAQYVRRIRVPEIDSISPRDRRRLARAFEDRDTAAATATALRLYGLDEPPRRP